MTIDNTENPAAVAAEIAKTEYDNIVAELQPVIEYWTGKIEEGDMSESDVVAAQEIITNNEKVLASYLDTVNRLNSYVVLPE